MRTIVFLLFTLFLSFSAGCSKSPTAIQKNNISPTATLEKFSNTSNHLGNISPEEVIELHKAMFKEVDRLSADDQLQFIDLNNAKITPLFVTELHPEVFVTVDKKHAVLCVSATDANGKLYPIDFYMKRNVNSDPHVYEVMIGEERREELMKLMKSGFYSKI